MVDDWGVYWPLLVIYVKASYLGLHLRNICVARYFLQASVLDRSRACAIQSSTKFQKWQQGVINWLKCVNTSFYHLVSHLCYTKKGWTPCVFKQVGLWYGLFVEAGQYIRTYALDTKRTCHQKHFEMTREGDGQQHRLNLDQHTNLDNGISLQSISCTWS